MSEKIDAKDILKVQVTQKDIERAGRKYQTEHYEECIWEDAVDVTNQYIESFEVTVDGLENIVSGLELKKDIMSDNLNQIESKYDQLETTYKKIKERPESMWSSEEREFMKTYDRKKQEVELEKKAMNLSLAEMDAIITNKEKEISSNEMRRDLLTKHRDLRVKPKHEEEAIEAQKAYEHWQELKEIAKIQEEAFS